MIPSPLTSGITASATSRDGLTFRPGVTYRVNYFVAAALLVGAVSLAGGVFALHRFQMRRLADLYLVRADEARKNGKLKESIRQVAAYVSMRPDDVDAQIRLAIERSQAARNSVEATAALVALEDTVRRLPGRTEPRRELVNLLLAFGRERDALRNMEVLSEINPGDNDLQLLIGKTQSQAGERKQAIATLERLVESAPKMTEAYAPLLELLREQEETRPQADALLTRLLAENGDSAEALLVCARDCRHRGALTESLGYARRAVEAAPENEEALILASDLIWLESNAGPIPAPEAELAQLILRFEHLIERTPGRPPLYVAIAQIEMSRRDPGAARQWLEKGLESCEDRRPLQVCLVEAMIQNGDLDEARDLITTLEQSGGEPRALEFMRARADMTVARWAAAAERLRRLRGEVLDRPELAFQVERSLAVCFAQLHHQAWEMGALEKALEFDRWSYQVRLRLAEVLADRGEFDDAIYHCRFLQAEHDVSLPLAAILIQAALQRPVEDRSLGEASDLIDQADERAGEAGPRSMDLRIRLLAAQERWSDAAALAESALKRFPGNASLLDARLSLLSRDKKHSEANALIDDLEKRQGISAAIILARLQLMLGTPGDSRQTAEERLGSLAALAADLSGEQRGEAEMALARAAESLNDDRNAARSWNRAIDAIPRDVRAWRGLLEFSLRHGDEKQARDCIEKLRDIEGSEGVYWRFGVVHLAIAAAENGDLDRIPEAEETLRTVVRVMPTSPEVFLLQARVADLKDQFRQATEYLQDAYDRGGRTIELATEIVRRLVQRQRFSDAESFIQNHRLTPALRQSSVLARLAAEISVRIGNRDDAVDRARQAVGADSQNIGDQLWLAGVMDQAGDAVDAGAVLEAACQLAPTEPSAWLARGAWLMRSGHETESRALQDKAIESIPESRRLLFLAQWEEMLGDPSRAADRYLEGLAKTPDDRETQLAAAAFFLKTGDEGRSEDLWRKLLASADTLSPDSIMTIRRGLAACLLLRRDYRGCVEGLTLLAQNAEGNETPGDRRIRARLLALMPDAAHRRKAIEELQRVEDSATLTDDDQMLLVQIYLSLGDWSGARRELITMTIRRPNDVRILGMAIREFLAHNEDLQNPEEWLGQMRELAPIHPLTKELSLRIMAASGEEDEALKRLQQSADGIDEFGFESEKPAINFARLAESLGNWFDHRKEPQKAQPFWSEAERIYRKQAPLGDDRRLELVEFLIRRRQLDEAASILAQIGEQVPQAQFVAAATQIAYLSGGRADACRISRSLIDSRIDVATANNADVLFSIASLEQLAGNYTEAESLCRRVIAMDPQPIAACNDLAFLLSLRESRHAEALELIDRALTSGGRVGWVLDTQATILRRAGKTDQALTVMQELIAEEATPTRRFHLAQALRDSGRGQEARAAFQAAIDSGLTESGLHPLERDEYREMKRQFLPASIEASLHRARLGVTFAFELCG